MHRKRKLISIFPRVDVDFACLNIPIYPIAAKSRCILYKQFERNVRDALNKGVFDNQKC